MQILHHGGLEDVPYTGGGWPPLCKDPRAEAKQPSFDDFRSVCQQLSRAQQIKFSAILPGSNGTVQANIAKDFGGGNIQFFTSVRKLDRPTGNARIRIGNAYTAKRYWNIILSSMWFSDAPCHQEF